MPRVVVLDDLGRLLLVHHDHRAIGRDEKFWVIPGGDTEPGETSLEAAVREVREETGVEVEILRLLWLVEEIDPAGKLRSHAYFLGVPRGGTLCVGYDPEFPADGQVIDDVRYMDRAEVAALGRVYPEIVRRDLWRFLDSGAIRLEREQIPTYRVRPTDGFG